MSCSAIRPTYSADGNDLDLVHVQDFSVGEEIIWITGEDQGRTVPCGRDHDQGVYRIGLLLGRKMGLAEHSSGALEVGSPVDAVTRETADDSPFQPADGADVVFGLQDSAVVGDPGECVHGSRAISPYLSQDRASDDGTVRGCLQRLMGCARLDVLVE